MIKIENTSVMGWEPAIRGMRNPMNSWEKSDSVFFDDAIYEDHRYIVHDINGKFTSVNDDTFNVSDDVSIGPNDRDLMLRLAKAGTEHAKYRRMITVYADITAPLYWWKEFDTYKVGTVANSCSTMHKIHSKPFELEDFSTDHLLGDDENPNYMLRAQIHSNRYEDGVEYPLDVLSFLIEMLNKCRDSYNATKDKRYWWQMIQLLPTSYNQKRTVMLNYENLSAIYRQRKDHKLDEWHSFCDWIKELPYGELITL